MSIRNEISSLEAIEILLDEARVEEEVELAILEALGELDDPRADEFAWDDLLSDELALDERPAMNVRLT
jgi:hypothetical protein